MIVSSARISPATDAHQGNEECHGSVQTRRKSTEMSGAVAGFTGNFSGLDQRSPGSLPCANTMRGAGDPQVYGAFSDTTSLGIRYVYREIEREHDHNIC